MLSLGAGGAQVAGRRWYRRGGAAGEVVQLADWEGTRGGERAQGRERAQGGSSRP